MNNQINYDFVIVYTFDFPKYNEHIEMLLLSIISVLREFKKFNIKIFIFTTTYNEIVKYFNKFNMLNNIEICLYEPNKYQQITSKFDNNRDHFNCIGHSRIFIVGEILNKMKCPVIYMDNDTGIKFNSSDECYKIITTTNKPIGYYLESWTTFDILYDNEGQLFELNNMKKTYPYINGKINPINNGIIIYPYNNEVYNFIEENIQIYNMLNEQFRSIYHDMFLVFVVINLII
jgi:hypothetical protein